MKRLLIGSILLLALTACGEEPKAKSQPCQALELPPTANGQVLQLSNDGTRFELVKPRALPSGWKLQRHNRTGEYRVVWPSGTEDINQFDTRQEALDFAWQIHDVEEETKNDKWEAAE